MANSPRLTGKLKAFNPQGKKKAIKVRMEGQHAAVRGRRASRSSRNYGEGPSAFKFARIIVVALPVLENCPDTKMDGDHDGVPCEQPWCN